MSRHLGKPYNTGVCSSTCFRSSSSANVRPREVGDASLTQRLKVAFARMTPRDLEVDAVNHTWEQARALVVLSHPIEDWSDASLES